MNWVDFELFTNLLNVSSHILVEASNLQGSSGSKEGVVSSKNSVGLLALGLSSDNNSVSGVSSVAVHVGTQLNLDKVFILESDSILRAW